MSKLMFASVISEIQQSDVFMTVKARICEAPEANLNGARVTEAFIDEIVSNETRYVGLPLYADKKALISGNYNRLGHLYDTKTGEFHSTQIGSFYKFEKQTISNGVALIGYARIPKRNRKLSKAISELFAEGALKFSFELSVGEYEELDDNTILIDASENNYLEGTAIVTFPACEEAVALELVAQKADEAKGGDQEMAEVETKAEVVETEAVQPEVAEEEKVEETKTVESEQVKTVEEDSETAACKDDKKKNAEQENAAVVMHESHEETIRQCAYDTETGKEVCQTISVETQTSNVEEGTLVESVDGIHVAEADGDNTETPTEEPSADPSVEPSGDPVVEPAEDPDGDAETPDVIHVEDTKKTAEQLIAEMLEVINGLKSEIAELKEAKTKAETVVAEINPFVDTIRTGNKYSLLEKDEKVSTYSLLSK